jgi:hypothetical protein
MLFFQQFVNKFAKIKYGLIAVNFLLVFFLIVLGNTGVLPMQMGDFIFFSLIYLIFALYRPGWSFLFFIGTVALENVNLAPQSLGLFVRPYQMIGALTIFSLLLRYFTKRLNFELVKLKWFDFVVGIFSLSGIASSVFAINKGIAFKQSIILVSFAALYWLTRNYIQTFDDLKRITPFFLSSSLIVVFYGIWQNIRFICGGNSFEVMAGRPNSTFTEADWLGIYLVVLIAAMYSIIYYRLKQIEELPREFKVQSSKFKVAVQSLKLFLPYLFLVFTFALLIISVSRSAWLGAGFVTLVFLKASLTNFSFRFHDWNGREFLRQLAYVVGTVLLSLGIVYIFHLTNFQLFNRAQSTGTGLQKITIACAGETAMPESIGNVEELKNYNCRHIDLEEIEKEKADGCIVKEIYRTDPNVNIRSQIYQKSFEEIKKHPVFGIGWGNISSILGNDERGTGLNSSNIFLEVWLGSGIIGLLAFLAIWVYILIKSVLYCITDDFESKIIGFFIVLGFFALLIPNMFNAGVFLGILWIWIGIVLSLSFKKE